MNLALQPLANGVSFNINVLRNFDRERLKTA
jgi:hypothetical protein